jgi:FkbM family methyltransferase
VISILQSRIDRRRDVLELARISASTRIKLDPALNLDSLPVIREVLVERAYADFFPFYEQATVVDVGAHKGYFSLFAWNNLAVRSRIIAVEPSSANFRCLTANISTNNAGIEPVNCAVFREDGKQTLMISDSKNHSLYGRSENPLSGDTGETIESVTLEHLLDRHNVPSVDFLKMDCEGAEYEIFFNTAPDVFKRIRTISLEFHDLKRHDFTGLALMRLFRAHGYTIGRFGHSPTRLNLNYGKLVAYREQ